MKRKLFSILALLLMAVTGATAQTVTWDSSNLGSFYVSGNGSQTIDGITMKSNASDVEVRYYNTVIGIAFDIYGATGGFTFTNTLGKNFTKIEIMAKDPLSEWEAAKNALGSGWSYSSGKAVWTGDAASVNLLTSYDDFVGQASSFVFYFDVWSVTLSPTEASLAVGGAALELTPNVAPEGWTDKVKWSVVQEGSIVALYTDDACTQAVGTDAIAPAKVYVKPLAAGQATVTVASNDGAKTATCAVTVTAPADPTYNVTFKAGTEDVGNWTIDPTSAKKGETVTVKYNGTKKVKSVKAIKK